MTHIHTATRISRPIEQVFDYVTTPGNWPRWHPSSLSVSGATDHSAAPGEQVIEAFLVVGRRGRVTWTVQEREAPRRWVIDGHGKEGGGATIAYTLTAIDEGTRFERELTYTFPNFWLKALDRLLFRRRIEAESTEALRRLKQALEADSGNSSGSSAEQKRMAISARCGAAA